MARMSTEQFISKAVAKHGNKYAYDNVVYVGTFDPIVVDCTKHGSFQTTPQLHIHLGVGCPDCTFQDSSDGYRQAIEGRNIKILTDGILKRATRVDVECGVCGHQWNASVGILFGTSRTKGTDCPICADKQRRISRRCKDISHRIPDENITLVTPYTGMNKKHTWSCKRCDNQWEATPSKIIYSKTNCPKCFSQNYSHMALRWLKSIEQTQGIIIQCFSQGGEYVIPGTRLKVDGYHADTNTVYEFYGDHYHGNLNVFQPHEHCHPHKRKLTAQELFDKTTEREQFLRDSGYNVVTMWEDDFKKQERCLPK